MVDHVKKWWSVYGTVVLASLTYLLPIAQNYVAAHPHVDTVIASVIVVLAKVSKSPKAA